MRTLKTGLRWGWEPKSCSRLGKQRLLDGQVSRNSSSMRCVSVLARTAGECPSHPLCRVQPIAFHQSRAPVYPTSLNDPLSRCLSQPTTSPQCLALTLSRSTRSHTVSPYLVLTPSHVRFRTSAAATWYLPLSTSRIVSLYSAYIWLCVARQDNSINAPTLSHARFDAPFNAQVQPTVAAPTVAAHTLLLQPHLHYWCTMQHTAHHTNHCYTNTAPYSTWHHSAHQPLLSCVEYSFAKWLLLYIHL